MRICAVGAGGSVLSAADCLGGGRVIGYNGSEEDTAMPLRDHFRSPLDDETQWEGFHGGWPMMIVAHLSRDLPRRYVAAPRVHSGAAVEIDVATYEKDALGSPSLPESQGNGGVATAVWAPPQPTLSVATDLPAQSRVRSAGLRHQARSSPRGCGGNR